jgi:radical SAM protein with 4Fe4S-binding SPASM domain
MLSNPFSEIYEKCNSGTGKEKLKNLPDFPHYVDIELCNYCNLSCQMCPTGTGGFRRTQGFMTGNVFYKVLNELSRHHTPIRFVRWGEPTLHRDLYKWIRRAKDKGLLTHLNTNGKILDVDQVCWSGLDSIKFSLHGEGLSEKTELLYHKEPRPYMTVTAYEGSIDGYFADDITTGKIRDLDKVAKQYHECPEVYDKLSIDWDGRVSACCGDYDRIMTVGDVKAQSLKEIWQGNKIKHYRTLLADFRHAELPLCKNCDGSR